MQAPLKLANMRQPLVKLRNETESLILQRLARIGPRSRADLARDIGVTRSTVGAPTARFLDLGVLRVAAESLPVHAADAKRSGRPGERLELAPDICAFVGVEISVDWVRVGLADLQGALQTIREHPIRSLQTCPDTVIDDLIDLIRDVTRGQPPIAGIAVSVPGIVTAEHHVLRAPLMGWRDVALGARLRDAFPEIGRIDVRNDASQFAASLALTDPALLEGNAVIAWLDAGIGGGIVAGGVLIEGHGNLAGEIGHMFVSSRANDRLRRLEDIIGSQSLLARYAELGGEGKTIEALLDCHRQKDTVAMAALDEWSLAMAEGLTNLTSILDPARMVFSGPMAHVLRCVEDQTFATYKDLLHYGTNAAQWHIIPADNRTLVSSGVELLRHSLFSYQT